MEPSDELTASTRLHMSALSVLCQSCSSASTRLVSWTISCALFASAVNYMRLSETWSLRIPASIQFTELSAELISSAVQAACVRAGEAASGSHVDS